MGVGSGKLHVAAKNNNVEKLRKLHSKGRDMNKMNEFGWTPLHVAAWSGRVEAVRVLVELGAAVDLPNEFGVTPLHYATQNGQTEVMRALVLDLGAEVEFADNNCSTPVHYAIHHNQIDALALLLRELASEVDGRGTIEFVDASGKKDTQSGETPLITAIQKGNLQAAKLLVREGANVHMASSSGKTALQLASESKLPEFEEFLLPLTQHKELASAPPQAQPLGDNLGPQFAFIECN